MVEHPPLGWCSWDVYGASVTEDEVREHAHYLRDHLRDFGWDHLVVDIQWYEPGANSSVYRPFVPLEMDGYARLVPAANRFPSAADGHGFAPLARDLHAMGLKFGIHMMRGIPRQAVHADAPILGTSATARDIALTNSICWWNTDMYGVDAQAPGAQEYYDSLAALYASWGVEYVKADDMLLPYAEGEIELLSSALKRCGRDITLSLSCGPTDPEHAEHLRTHADLWRVSGDFWDDWSHLYAMFEHCARWAPHGGHGHWPDADMLPLGRIALRSHEHGLGERWTRFTRDEQRTMLSLWCIVGSPLLLGTHLPSLDDWTLGLLTNRDVLDVSRQAREPRQLYRRGDTVAWWARNSGGGCYLAVFNTGVSARAIATALPTDVGGSSLVRDLWTRTDLGPVIGTLTTDVPGHGVRLFSLTPEG